MQKLLLAVCDMVVEGQAVLFDSSGLYALNKKTGEKIWFRCSGKGWELKLHLEAPNQANEIMNEIVAEGRVLGASGSLARACH